MGSRFSLSESPWRPPALSRLQGSFCGSLAGVRRHTSKCNCRVTHSATRGPRVAGHARSQPRIRACPARLRTDALPVSPTSAELPTGGTVRPVVRWGTDVMHRKGAARDVVRRGAAWPGGRHGRHDVRRRRGRARGLPDRGRPGRVRLRLSRRVRDHPPGRGVQPGRRAPRGHANVGSTTARRAACPTRAPSSTAPGPTGPGSPGRASTARTSPTRATGCSPGACSTRPTTSTGRSSATGSTTGRARSCARQMEAAAEDYPRDWPVGEDVEAPVATPGRRGRPARRPGRGRRPLSRCRRT